MSCDCMVVTPSPDKMIIVGGVRDELDILDIIEECIVHMRFVLYIYTIIVDVEV